MDEHCQKCGVKPAEFDSPARLCEPCWGAWWHCRPNSDREIEWDKFFDSIGRPEMKSTED
jgi:hypothetical protein